MLKITEDEFQQTVIDLARALGWKVAHFRPAKTEKGWRTAVSADGAGFPDLVLAKPGCPVIYAEIKSNDGRLSDEQARWLRILELCPGTETYIWRPVDYDKVKSILCVRVAG